MKYLKLFEAFDDDGDDEMSWTKYFEVLSIKYSVGGDDFRLITPEHPEFNDCVQDCVESGWKKDEIEIYSVRRKEDGEVFTLGQPIYNVTINIRNFGIIDKIWPSFHQMRVDIGNGGIVVNHSFYKSSTIVDMKKKGINKYYAKDINESEKFEGGEWYDFIGKYQVVPPSISDLKQINDLLSEHQATISTNIGGYKNPVEEDTDIKSLEISSESVNIVIWKLNDEYWAVYVTYRTQIEGQKFIKKVSKNLGTQYVDLRSNDRQSYYICDQIDDMLNMLKILLEQ